MSKTWNSLNIKLLFSIKYAEKNTVAQSTALQNMYGL